MGWRLSITEHPRKSGVLIYDLREDGRQATPSPASRARLTRLLTADGFAGRLIEPVGRPAFFCLRATSSPRSRKALQGALRSTFPQADLTDQPLDSIVWGVRSTLMSTLRNRHEPTPSSRQSIITDQQPGRRGDTGSANRADGEFVDAGPGDGAGGNLSGLGDSASSGDLSDDSFLQNDPIGDPYGNDDLFVPRDDDLSWETFRPADRAEGNIRVLGLLSDLRASGRPPLPDERRVLSRYVGWGALPEALDRSYGAGQSWRSRSRQALESYLTDRAAMLPGSLTPTQAELMLHHSILNAHYTSPAVVRALWGSAVQAGFAGGRVLEPSAGAGIFLGLMPEDLRRRSQVTAVEIEPIAADVLRALYPEAQVREGGFQDQRFPTGYFDCVITNVPFANTPVYDAGSNQHYHSLHDYFIQRSLTLLRPGGIGVFLTSAFTLDKINPATRDEMGRHAKLLGAVRLPYDSQEAQAGSRVVEDALVFRALFPGEAPDTSFRESRRVAIAPTVETQDLIPDNTTNVDPAEQSGAVNTLFWDHPERVLGRWEITQKWGMTLTVAPRLSPVPLADRIASGLQDQIAHSLQESGPSVRPSEDDQDLVDGPTLLRPATAEWGPGSLALHEDDQGRPAIIELVDLAPLSSADSQTSVWTYRVVAPADSASGQSLMQIIALRDALQSVFRTDAEADRTILNALYDAFVADRGFLSAPKNRRLFQTDPYAGRLLALEQKDKETGAVIKADVFTRSLHAGHALPRPGTVTDLAAALMIGYAQYGDFRPEALTLIGDLLTPALRGDPDEPVSQLLIQEGLVFRDPATEQLVLADTYLSGFLLDKIEAARLAARQDPQYVHNVRALEAVLPPQVTSGDILVDMGASWIPPDVIGTFIAQLQNRPYVPSDPFAVYHPALGWQLTDAGTRAVGALKIGTERMKPVAIFTALLDRKPLLVYDVDEDGARILNRAESQAAQAAGDDLKARFRTFLWEDENRARRLCDLYNRQFNGYRPPTYRGETLPDPPGLSPSLALYPTQKNMILRGICEKGGICAHDVGMGKTLTQIILAHEMVRLGIARHPLIVVKKSTLEQFAQAAQSAFPGNRYLVMTNADLAKDQRARFLGRALTQRFDAIILTQETFRLLSVTAHIQKAVLMEQIMTLQDSLEFMKNHNTGRGLTRKQIAKRLAHLKDKLESVQKGMTEAVTLDGDLRIDALFVDEAHLYKNDGAVRSLDLQMKVAAIRAVRHDPHGIFLATATPVSNSLDEIHRMLSYPSQDLLRRVHIGSLGAFRSTFIDTNLHWEPHHAGAGWALKARDSLINVPEIMRILLTVMDRRTVATDAPGIIKVPEKILKVIEVPMTETQQAIMEDIADRAVNRKGERKGNGKDKNHIFSLMDRAAKCSCDVRLLDRNDIQGFIQHSDDIPASSKLPAVAQNIKDVYDRTQTDLGTQMVFLDMGVPGGSQIDLYQILIQQIVALGIPEHEIKAIHEAATDVARARFLEDINNGKIRVALGSTGKMAEGVNAQERLAAVHIVNPPWRPDIVDQIIGRMIRQGNRNEQGQVFFYAAVSESGAVSPDAFRYHLLQWKSDAFRTILSGTYTKRVYDPSTTMSFGEIAATASGNPLVMEKFQRDAAVATAEAHTRFLFNERQRLRSAVSLAEFQEQTEQNYITFYEALPVLDGPEIWFACDADGQPDQEIGERQDILDWLRTRETINNTIVLCRNIPVTIQVQDQQTRLAIRLPQSVVNPDETRSMISVVRFSSVDALVKKLSADRRTAIINEHRSHQESAKKTRLAKIAEIRIITQDQIPQAEAAEEAARAALVEIEQRLLDQQKAKMEARQARKAALTPSDTKDIRDDEGDGQRMAI